jgi:hypothetical protein
MAKWDKEKKALSDLIDSSMDPEHMSQDEALAWLERLKGEIEVRIDTIKMIRDGV